MKLTANELKSWDADMLISLLVTARQCGRKTEATRIEKELKGRGIRV
jgi:hypothetical protein